ncbi:hypothetical protein ACJMK2_009928 [Sinanodonta woodiana]|uniref:RWD domain-containing protein n=1 Tax=Sinanodonta woodiana TaxID=1069815 RepID=A0ABD3VDR6_SINWO
MGLSLRFGLHSRPVLVSNHDTFIDHVNKWNMNDWRKTLALVDLDNPEERVFRVTRQSKWDISCVQWNPHASHAHLFVTASNNKLDLFSWQESNTKPECSMKGHSRNISDLDWSSFDVNVIASCSTDNFTHLWDKVYILFLFTIIICTFFSAGASQVKWNKVTNNCFATAHDGDVRIWDPRKGNTSLVYIAAHLSKIHGLDWNPFNEYTFATSSQDGTVKFWDFTNPRHDKGMLNSGSPVWRARYTPFGHGLITVVVPQLRRGENSLYLWNNDSLQQPVHQFIGHSDVVLEFQWRKSREGKRDYQLVTWSKDQSMRIWKIDSQLQRLCGHDAIDSSENEMSAVDANDAIETEPKENMTDQSLNDRIMYSNKTDSLPQQQPMNLTQEFSLVNKNIPNVKIEEMAVQKRSCKATAVSGKNSVTLTVRFPTNYPNGTIPSFEITESTVNSTRHKKLQKVLVDTAQKFVKRNTNCLEPCLRQFSAAFDKMTLEEKKTPDSDIFPMLQASSKLLQSGLFSAYQDESIPFPRTCGAKFCPAGYLVCFGRSKEAKKGFGRSDVTPKTLSELAVYAPSIRVRSSQSASGFPVYSSKSPPTPNSEMVSVSMYYKYKDRRPRTKSRIKDDSDLKPKDPVKSSKIRTMTLAPVCIYEISSLLTINRLLGEEYRIDLDNIPRMCQHNMKAALAVGRKDLVQLWSLISQISNPNLMSNPSFDPGSPWALNPFGRQMLESLMQYYQQIYDVQSLAMICCVFWSKQGNVQPPVVKPSASKSSLVEGTPVNGNITFLPGSSSDSGWNLLSIQKVKRSNSWSDFSMDDYRFAEDGDPKEKAIKNEKQQHENDCRLLDPSHQAQYEQYLRTYANILYCWKLLTKSAEVLKHMSTPLESHRGIEFGVVCHNCGRNSRGARCDNENCLMLAFQCVICHTGVRGASNFCLLCGHGGHAEHMLEWFQLENKCPTGCGCFCLNGDP